MTGVVIGFGPLGAEFEPSIHPEHFDVEEAGSNYGMPIADPNGSEVQAKVRLESGPGRLTSSTRTPAAVSKAYSVPESVWNGGLV